jgi:hypothetical protein
MESFLTATAAASCEDALAIMSPKFSTSAAAELSANPTHLIAQPLAETHPHLIRR